MASHTVDPQSEYLAPFLLSLARLEIGMSVQTTCPARNVVPLEFCYHQWKDLEWVNDQGQLLTPIFLACFCQETELVSRVRWISDPSGSTEA